MPPCRVSDKARATPSQRLLSKPDFGLASKTAKPVPRQYPWKVVHACEFAREVLPLVQGQLAAGIRPYLLTPRGYGSARSFLEQRNSEASAPVSLLQTWSHVREW